MNQVLVVEDDADQMNRIIKILEKYRDTFMVLPARDGKDAIDILNQETVSLVVTDIQMPRLNGLILLAYVHTYFPSTPCIVMTAYGTSRLKSKLTKDTLRFFQKPFDVHDLANAIIIALDRDDTEASAEGISIISFLNLIEMEKTTCILEIITEGNPPGRMYFVDGILYDAECGGMTGEAAALEIISWKKITPGFDFSSRMEHPRKIKSELHDLIRNVLGPGDDNGEC
jgi:CheY-like chemotaxis protein